MKIRITGFHGFKGNDVVAGRGETGGRSCGTKSHFGKLQINEFE